MMHEGRARARLPLEGMRVRGLVLAVVGFSVFTNLLMLTGPLFMLQVYDRVLGSRSEETLVALSILVAALYVLYGVLDWARGRVMARVGARMQSALNGPVFRAVLERSALGRGPKAGALKDLDAVRTLSSAPVLLALFDAPWTPVFLVGIFLFHPLLGWLALGGGAILVVVAILNQALSAAKARDGAAQAAEASRFARQAELGGDVLWSQGMVRAMTDRWAALQTGAMRDELSASDRSGSFAAFTKAFRLFVQSAMLAVGAWLVLRGALTAGAMIAGSILLGRALAPVEVIVSQWSLVQRGRSGWRDLARLLTELPERPVPTPLPVPEAHLELKGVSVTAKPGGTPLLAGVSLDLEPGEALGVIGRSGSGKTTLARLIVGLIRPVSGEVRLGGATLEQFGAEGWGMHVGYLPQEVRLFEGTLAENIAQMALEPDAGKVISAARKARVHEVILALPEGYDTRVGTTDARLSGGQKQRLALARALYGDPPLLVLDEPNSALDAEGSEALNAALLAKKAEGGSVIVMTHRPTAVSACDRLLVLEAGRVAGYGPRDEIVRAMLKNADDVQRVMGGGRG